MQDAGLKSEVVERLIAAFNSHRVEEMRALCRKRLAHGTGVAIRGRD
jgi:hypothetical protein